MNTTNTEAARRAESATMRSDAIAMLGWDLEPTLDPKVGAKMSQAERRAWYDATHYAANTGELIAWAREEAIAKAA
jgi:hypothetical protein